MLRSRTAYKSSTQVFDTANARGCNRYIISFSHAGAHALTLSHHTSLSRSHLQSPFSSTLTSPLRLTHRLEPSPSSTTLTKSNRLWIRTCGYRAPGRCCYASRRRCLRWGKDSWSVRLGCTAFGSGSKTRPVRGYVHSFDAVKRAKWLGRYSETQKQNVPA